MRDLQRSMSQGEISIRFLAVVAALCLLFSSFLGIIDMLLHFRLPGALLQCYIFVMGCIMLLLESFGTIHRQVEDLSDSERLQLSTQMSVLEYIYQNIVKYALFLDYVSGRGALYAFAGSLHLIQDSWIVGGCVVFVGIAYIVVARQTAHKLTRLRQSLTEHTLRATLEQADGKLTMIELKHWADSKNIPFARRELEVAFTSMDKRNAGYLTLDEVLTWWSDGEERNALL